MLWYIRYMNGIHTVVVGDRGRIVVPAEVRENEQLSEGTPLVMLSTSGGLVLMTRDQLLQRVRGELKGLDLVGELLADRRRASKRADQA